MFKQALNKSKRFSAILTLVIIMLSVFAIPSFANGDVWPTMPDIDISTTTSNESSDILSPVATTGGTLSPTDTPGSNPSTLPDNDILAGDIDDARNVYNAYVDVMPVVSTNDILKWATTKGNEVIYFLQIIVQPFTIIIFIIAAFITLIGSIGRGDMVGKGLWGMVMSVVVYAAVLYAPVILQTFVGWVAS